MGRLRFGWAETSITPEKRISLSGQFAERISEYVQKPLTVTALAVTDGKEQMVIASADLGAIGWNLMEDIRKVLAGNSLGLDPMKILVTAIHTHTGPVYPHSRRRPYVSPRGMLEKLLPPGKKYIERVSIATGDDIATGEEIYALLVERISETILNAWKNLADGSFTNAFGRAPVGMCRRSVYSDGSAQMWGDTFTASFEELEGGSDSGIELLYIKNSSGALTGVVANLACPAQCVQHRHFVSPDYWGEVKFLLRRHFGENIFLLPLCSPAGDQCPIDLIRYVEPESDINDPNIIRNNPPKRKADPSMFDLAGMRKVGRRIAREIIDVFEDGLDEPVDDAVLFHTYKDAALPIRRVTMSDAAKAKAAIIDYLRSLDGDPDYLDAAKLYAHLGTLERFELQECMDILKAEIHVIRLGDIAIASNPFELFLNYGNKMRARSLASQTFLIQLCNGWEGYLPTAKAEKGGHYSGFVASGSVGHVGGEQLVRETVEEIRRLFR